MNFNLSMRNKATDLNFIFLSGFESQVLKSHIYIHMIK